MKRNPSRWDVSAQEKKESHYTGHGDERGFHGYEEGEWVYGESGGASVMQLKLTRKRRLKPGVTGNGNYLKRKCEHCTKPFTVWACDAKFNAGRFCSLVCSRACSERPACRAAIIQALRYHFRVEVVKISKLMNVASQNVSSLTVTDSTMVLPWCDRRYQAEAIAAAEQILREAGLL